MQDTLASLIKVVSACEIDIDKARYSIKTLASGQYHKAFHLVDSNQSGFVTAAEIARFLKTYGVDGTHDEVQAIISYYDFSRKSGLNVEDFIGAITPREDYSKTKKLEDKELDHALIKFFAREIALLRKTLPYRQQLVHSDIWTSFDSFKCIDNKGKGSFTCTDLDAFLQKNGVSLSSPEITAAFNRMDKDGKSKVTFPDFQNNLLHEISERPERHERHEHYEHPIRDKFVRKVFPREHYLSRPAPIIAEPIETPTFTNSDRYTLPTRSQSPLRLNDTYLSRGAPLNFGAHRHNSISQRPSPISSPGIYTTPKRHPLILPFNSEDRARTDFPVHDFSRSPRPLSHTTIHPRPNYRDISPQYTREPLDIPRIRSQGIGYTDYPLTRPGFGGHLPTGGFNVPPLSIPSGSLFGGRFSSPYNQPTYAPIQRGFEPRSNLMPTNLNYRPRLY